MLRRVSFNWGTSANTAVTGNGGITDLTTVGIFGAASKTTGADGPAPLGGPTATLRTLSPANDLFKRTNLAQQTAAHYSGSQTAFATYFSDRFAIQWPTRAFRRTPAHGPTFTTGFRITGLTKSR